MKLRHPFALVLSAIIVVLAAKAWALPASGLGLVLESAVLLGLWLAAEQVARVPWKPVRIAGLVSFYLLFHLIVASILIHAQFFQAATERRLSLLELDLRTIGYFFESVLPARRAWLLGALMVIVHLGALAWMRAGRKYPPVRRPWPWLAGALTVSILLISLRARVASPLADVTLGLWDGWNTPTLPIDRARPPLYAPATLDRASTAIPGSPVVYDKVLVFVMETMTQATLDREARVLPETTFVRSRASHAHTHSRYFATNQDSRTGMLSMLGSRFIPYEAYAPGVVERYAPLGHQRSLVDLFKDLGYRTAFAASQQEIELVVRDLHWDELLHLDAADTVRLGKDHLCFVPYEFEHGCEDKSLLPRVLDFLDKNPRAFLYQEFIWGHVTAYNEASGRTNTDYYSAYLDAVVEHLERTGQLAHTLIVLTSDHGFRYKAWQTDRAVYQIPLWFYAPRFAATTDERLLSHLDFKDLLLHELFAAPAPEERPFVLVVGPTGLSFLTALTRDQLLLLKARPGGASLLHAEGYPDPQTSRVAAADYLRLYDDYVGYFDRAVAAK